MAQVHHVSVKKIIIKTHKYVIRRVKKCFVISKMGIERFFFWYIHLGLGISIMKIIAHTLEDEHVLLYVFLYLHSIAYLFLKLLKRPIPM